MSIKTFKPTTPSRRHMTVNGFDGINKHAKPEASLTEVLKKNAGRNSYGRITVRHRGGGEKRYIIAPVGLTAGDKVLSSASADIKPGNCLPIANIPVGLSLIHI